MEIPKDQYVDFVVTARKYQTLLTNKYKNRPVWTKHQAGEVRSTLPGTIIEITVQEGQEVNTGELLLIQESMKMLNRILSPVTGKVESICVHEGDKIGKSILMLKISN